MLRVAEGEIVQRTSVVHGGGTMLEDEEKVLISKLTTNGECTHPDHSYSMEEGGFCCWNRVNIRKK